MYLFFTGKLRGCNKQTSRFHLERSYTCKRKKKVELFFLYCYNMIILIQQIEMSHNSEKLSTNII